MEAYLRPQDVVSPCRWVRVAYDGGSDSRAYAVGESTAGNLHGYARWNGGRRNGYGGYPTNRQGSSWFHMSPPEVILLLPTLEHLLSVDDPRIFREGVELWPEVIRQEERRLRWDHTWL